MPSPLAPSVIARLHDDAPASARPRLTPVPTAPANDPVDALTRDLAAACAEDRPLVIEVEHGSLQSSLAFALSGPHPDTDLFALYRVARARGAAIVSATCTPEGIQVRLLVTRPDLRRDERPPVTWRSRVSDALRRARATLRSR